MAVQHCPFFSLNPPFLQLARRDEADRGHCKASCSLADARRFHEFTFRSPRGLQPFFLLERVVSFQPAWKAFTRPTLPPYSRGAMSFARCARSSLCAKLKAWGEEWRLRFVNPTANQGGRWGRRCSAPSERTAITALSLEHTRKSDWRVAPKDRRSFVRASKIGRYHRSPLQPATAKNGAPGVNQL